jgi:hypothetical protein
MVRHYGDEEEIESMEEIQRVRGIVRGMREE